MAGLLVRVAAMLSNLGMDTDNPLASRIYLADLSIGWGVIMIGAVLAIVASVVPRTEGRK